MMFKPDQIMTSQWCQMHQGHGVWCNLWQRMVLTLLGGSREYISLQTITVKELLPIVIAAAIWGSRWVGKTIRAQCDNAAIVAVLSSRTSKEVEVMHLLRCLAFLQWK